MVVLQGKTDEKGRGVEITLSDCPQGKSEEGKVELTRGTSGQRQKNLSSKIPLLYPLEGKRGKKGENLTVDLLRAIRKY